MPQITILRRQLTIHYPEPGKPADIVAVTFSTPALPPRSVIMARDQYRQATVEELAGNPRYGMLPATPEAAALELKTILQDMARHFDSPPETITV